MAEVRIAAFVLEHFDETTPGDAPSLDEWIRPARPRIVGLRADVAIFQKVDGQSTAARHGMSAASDDCT